MPREQAVILTFSGRLEFEYTNWHNETHTYRVAPIFIEFGPYDNDSKQPSKPKEEWVWVIHADVELRDGLSRSGRRTFILSEIRNPISVND